MKKKIKEWAKNLDYCSICSTQESENLVAVVLNRRTLYMKELIDAENLGLNILWVEAYTENDGTYIGLKICFKKK